MDIQPQDQQPISDDQELAKVLAGVNKEAEEADVTASDDTADNAANSAAADDTAAESSVVMPDPIMPPVPEPVIPSVSPVAPAPDSGDLESIKKDALTELRPLVDKLNVTPKEKFDTYLLLLRSTDDQTLVAPAHEAAKLIEDETARAQALLDIVKEIDYFAGQGPKL